MAPMWRHPNGPKRLGAEYRDDYVYRHIGFRYDPPYSLQWRHNGCGSVSSRQPHDCLLNRLFRRRSKKTSKLRVTGLCVGNSPGTGEFPAQITSNAENVSIWWRHHDVHEFRRACSFSKWTCQDYLWLAGLLCTYNSQLLGLWRIRFRQPQEVSESSPA